MDRRRDELLERLFSREDPGLRRVSVPGGGEVYQGPLATRALRALGARAMTVDRSIVVGPDFDPARPESLALYAHERVHQQSARGGGVHYLRDAEEIAARATERMVLHRARAGEDVATLLSGRVEPATSPAGGSSASGEPRPEDGYAALRAAGLDHDAIVERLARELVEALEREARERASRFPGPGEGRP